MVLFPSSGFRWAIVGLAATLVTVKNAGAQANEPPAILPPFSSFQTVPLALGAAPLLLGDASLSFGATSISIEGVPLASPAVAMPDLEAKAEGGGKVRFTLNADVLFAFDKATLKPEADDVLRAFLEQVLKQFPSGARFRIEGHTDAIGTDRYNATLSQRRARSVEAWLLRRARIARRLVTTAAFGKTRPIAPNVQADGSDDPEGRQRNRRVEIVVEPAA